MFEPISKLSDIISNNWSWISEAEQPEAVVVDKVKNGQLAKTGRKFSQDAENLMRLFKVMEPACMALTLWGWNGGAEALILVGSTRKLITTIVRPLKAANALRNNQRGECEDKLSWVLRTYVAPVSYGSLAVASGAIFLAKRGVIPPFTDWSKSCIDKYLSHGGTAGNIVGGLGGFYAWYRTSQKIVWSAPADDSKELKDLKDLRFWSLCNGLRYTMEGAVGIVAINYGPLQGWTKVLTKAAPASIGLYQSVVRAWIQAA